MLDIKTNLSHKSEVRCKLWRKKILEISQKVQALHIAPAFSCVEITDTIYFDLLKIENGKFSDIFIMSKGHGCLIQYVILNALNILSDHELSMYCKPQGILGAHPDFGVPGIHASTGSLGHGLGIAVGQALGEKMKSSSTKVYCLISDGELQEGSTWEALMMAANLRIDNLIVLIDLNDFGGLERMSLGHPSFYPIKDKLESFGWETFEVDGHNPKDILEKLSNRANNLPTVLICKTVKGKGVSFMENVPIWHYRSPTLSEYTAAITEIDSINA